MTYSTHEGSQWKQIYTAFLCYIFNRTLWRSFLPPFSILMNLNAVNIRLIFGGEIYLLSYFTLSKCGMMASLSLLNHF